MNERNLFSLNLFTWSKSLVYILPVGIGSILPPILSLIPILASIGWGIRKSKDWFERICGFIMVAVWVIWGRHLGIWVAAENRQGWQVLGIGALLYLFVEESDYLRGRNHRRTDEWE